MSQSPFQPPPGGPPLPPPVQVPQPPKQKRPKRFGWLEVGWIAAGFLTAVVALGVGAAVGGAGDDSSTALPAPTVTVTTTPPAVEGGGEPTDEPTQQPTKAPGKWAPRPSDFRLTVKVTDKQCFGSAGCSVTYKVKLAYLGSAKIPDQGSTDITYKITGGSGPIVGTVTLDSEGKYDVSEDFTDTKSSSAKLVAKVTEVDYNEFG